MKFLRYHLPGTILGLALATALSGASQAAVISSQPGVNGGMALEANYSSTGFFGIQNADSYSLATASTLTGVRWWGTDANSNLFVVRVFGNPSTDLAAPAIEALSGSVSKTPEAGVTDDAGSPIYRYEMTLSSSRALSAGVGYVSVYLDSDSDTWFWLQGSGSDQQSLFRGVEGAPWMLEPPDLSLELIGERQSGPLPEPSTSALLLTAAVFAFRRRMFGWH